MRFTCNVNWNEIMFGVAVYKELGFIVIHIGPLELMWDKENIFDDKDNDGWNKAYGK